MGKEKLVRNFLQRLINPFTTHQKHEKGEDTSAYGINQNFCNFFKQTTTIDRPHIYIYMYVYVYMY